MQESSSKTQFTLRMSAPASVTANKTENPSNLRIFTTGLRTKLLFQVYAFGLYFDEEKYLEEFSARFGSAKADAVAKDHAFFSFAASGRFSRAISLCMLRDITGEDMKEAFNVSLGERLRKFEHEIKAGDDEADPDDALHQFQSQFSGRKLTKGTRIVFVWDHHGAPQNSKITKTCLPFSNTVSLFLGAGRSIRTYIQGEPTGVVKSQLLNRCLWDVYCGESPIDKNAKVLLAKTTTMLSSKKKQSQLKAKL
eukprot:TRINITY_DN3076_c0_g1_i2.p1 TRINITY_DN3076_c0_g1~~TRINITY_DN3076_c0_g1_i2.p1  ORF type:complete len:252 (-),score=39.04 TRINITY_DN3076_c0_g1_i2:144-899(-)